MGPTPTLDLISKDKIHHFFALLPLITLILLDVPIWILIIYTIFFALWEVYTILLISFKKLVTKEAVNMFDVNKKNGLKKLWIYFKEKFWFVDNLKIPAIAGFVVIISYIITFILSIVYLEVEYMWILLLSHVFLLVFMWRLISIIKHLSSTKQVKEAYKK